MQTNNILTAELLDILFDNRNKDYGAYQLRKTYPQQIKKALLVTATITLLVFGSLLARSPKRGERNKFITKTINLSSMLILSFFYQKFRQTTKEASMER